MRSISRTGLRAQAEALLRQSPVVAFLGPRQSGKTTLALELLESRKGIRFDLEDPRDARALAEPMTALEPLKGLVVIDEVQRQPGLFKVIRVLADRKGGPARFLVLGSASPELLQQSSETLAGRLRFLEVQGFSLDEVGAGQFQRRLHRGGFPRSFLARSDAESFGWREDFIRTFIERDLGSLGIRLRSPAQLRQLWTMLAHRHGQLWNGAQLAGALGETYTTVKHHLQILCGALVVRQLAPWLPNLEKRLVKSPKVYIRDSGLVTALLGLRSWKETVGHPGLGALWEGMVIEELLRHINERELFFWSTHAGAELDALWARGAQRIGFEMKWGDAPRLTKAMHIALSDLDLKRLWVIYPGPKRYRLSPQVEVLPISELSVALS